MREPGLVVVGASLAGLRAVESARRAGHTGPITLVGAEHHLPYDRPPLSKAFLDAPDPVVPTFDGALKLSELGVEVRLGRAATGLSLDEHAVLLGDEHLPFDSLVIATGCTPVALPGVDRTDGVHTLRTVEDAQAVRCGVRRGARTVLVGGGFIGAEIATALRARGAEVTIVEAADVPLVRAVGPVMAPALATLHARAGVALRCGVTVRSLRETAAGTRIELSDSSTLDADLVLVGIGARPATGWLDGSGLLLDNGVVCDETLRAAPGVYAAGDVARWHNRLFDTTMRLENWTAAAEQGTAAGRHAAAPASATAVETVPYFWSDWYGHRIQMVGVAAADEVTVVGEPDGVSWVALYRAGERIVGALALNQPRTVMKYRAMIARRSSWDTALEFAGAAAALPSSGVGPKTQQPAGVRSA